MQRNFHRSSFDDTEAFLLEHLQTMPGELLAAVSRQIELRRRMRWAWAAGLLIATGLAAWALLDWLR